MTRKRQVSPTKPTTRKRGASAQEGNPAAAARFPAPASASHDSSSSAPLALIEIEPTLPSGFTANRFDILIRGRAISLELIDEIRLEADGVIVSASSYGEPERAMGVQVADGRVARQWTFRFNLPCPGVSGPVSFDIVARTTDGREQGQRFDIDLDTTLDGGVDLLSGPSRMGVGSGRPHAIVHIERAVINPDGLLTVGGWAVAAMPVLAVQIFADGNRVSKAKFGFEREDVGSAFPAFPNAVMSGFTLSLQLDPEDQDAAWIGAQVVCPNGFGHMESVPVERPKRRSAPRGEVIEGTTPPPASVPFPSSIASPQAAPAISASNQQPAHNLKAAIELQDDPLVGLVLPATHNLDQEPEEAGIGAQPEASNPEISMFCDFVELSSDGSLKVSGWAVCRTGIVQVRVLLDEELVGLASLGYERDDVGQIFPDIRMANLSGFRFDGRAASAAPGSHRIRLVVRSQDGGERDAELDVATTEPSVPPVVQGEVDDLPISRHEPESRPASGQTAEFRFELDAPALSQGVAVTPVTGRLTIDGWLLSRSGIASFEVWLDGERLGDVHHGLVRQDVGAAFPDWPNAMRAGYAFHCPPRSLHNGDHNVELRIRAESGAQMSRSFRITVQKFEGEEGGLGIRRNVPRAEIDMLTAMLRRLGCSPSFHIVLRQPGDVDAEATRKTINSLVYQKYTPWTATVLADGKSAANAVQGIVDALPGDVAARFDIIAPSSKRAWCAPLTAGRRADGSMYCLLSAGDELGADALMELALAQAMHSGCDLIYADEVRVSPVSNEREPFFKPDYSPDLLLSTNYIGRPWAVDGRMLDHVGATAATLLDKGEYDLLLRCVERSAGVHHVAKLLCERGNDALDMSPQEQAALEATLKRRKTAGRVLPGAVAGTWRLRRTSRAKGKVSIIIPTCAAQNHIETCINSLRTKTSYRNFEIVCIENIPLENAAARRWVRQHADKVVAIDEPFNWSVFNNRAAEVADGEYLLFMNDDMEVLNDDWLEAMLEHAQRPEVGLTGARLLYADGTVQHAGMFLSTTGIGRHAFRLATEDDPCYFGLSLTQRNVMAVTGACMMVRRSVFEQLGRFNEAHQIVNNDLDFCLRVHKAGLLTVYTPYARLTHYELASRLGMQDVFDLTRFNAEWKTTFAAGDPYFNPRLSYHSDDFRPDEEAVEWVVPGAPLFHPEEIRRILVVKLDHIGDFVTALPPIRRLKALFPAASITVLAGPASKAFVALEPCIDEFIPFAFFHARSQLGERELTDEDYAGLEAQLLPKHFDLAVDLRKHKSTRDILKHTGAQFLAGFDHSGQFPFLDIALEWDGDRSLQPKRSHVVDDLIGLVNAIGHASEPDRLLMQPPPPAMPLDAMAPEIAALFVKPVVAIHPGAGNITKQWPVEHFSALIDLLVERHGVNILLVGGPDDVAVAEELVAHAARPEALGIVAGKLPLADLPRMLRNCVLYVGNDSGPKHIAAAVGLPTVGIHSGVVDPMEWGPIGPSAVAMRRNMSCGPCYLANAADCPRQLACLKFLEPPLVYETVASLLTLALPSSPAGVPEQSHPSPAEAA